MSEAGPKLGIAKIAVAPVLNVRNGAAAIEFYKAAFGAEVLFRHDGENGKVVCELGLGGGRFWLGDEEPEYGNLSPETLGGSAVRMVIELDDPDAIYARAVAAGATAVCPVQDEHAWRIGKLKDPFGHVWEIGRRN